MKRVLLIVAVSAMASAGSGRAQEPAIVETSPWVQISLYATKTTLIPGEPPRVTTETHVVDRPGRYPVCDDGIQVAVPGNDWVRVQLASSFAGVDSGAPLVAAPNAIRGTNLLVWRPGEEHQAPAYAFSTVGEYDVRVLLRIAFADPATQSQAFEDFVASNAVHFSVVEPSGVEADAAAVILEDGWLSGTRSDSNYWFWAPPEAWPRSSDAEEFLRAFPSGVYSDHVRFHLAMNLLGGAKRLERVPDQTIQRIIDLLVAIDMGRFSWADLGLRWLTVLYYRLGRLDDAAHSWWELQALPYPTPCKNPYCETVGGWYPPATERQVEPSDRRGGGRGR